MRHRVITRMHHASAISRLARAVPGPQHTSPAIWLGSAVHLLSLSDRCYFFAYILHFPHLREDDGLVMEGRY